MAKWIDFILLDNPGRSRKTEQWRVITKTKDGTQLGFIKWHGAWRGYAFFPDAHTLFEPTCLADIADWIEKADDTYRSRPTGAAKSLAEPL